MNTNNIYFEPFLNSHKLTKFETFFLQGIFNTKDLDDFFDELKKEKIKVEKAYLEYFKEKYKIFKKDKYNLIKQILLDLVESQNFFDSETENKKDSIIIKKTENIPNSLKEIILHILKSLHLDYSLLDSEIIIKNLKRTENSNEVLYFYKRIVEDYDNKSIKDLLKILDLFKPKLMLFSKKREEKIFNLSRKVPGENVYLYLEDDLKTRDLVEISRTMNYIPERETTIFVQVHRKFYLSLVIPKKEHLNLRKIQIVSKFIKDQILSKLNRLAFGASNRVKNNLEFKNKIKNLLIQFQKESSGRFLSEDIKLIKKLIEKKGFKVRVLKKKSKKEISKRFDIFDDDRIIIFQLIESLFLEVKSKNNIEFNYLISNIDELENTFQSVRFALKTTLERYKKEEYIRQATKIYDIMKDLGSVLKIEEVQNILTEKLTKTIEDQIKIIYSGKNEKILFDSTKDIKKIEMNTQKFKKIKLYSTKEFLSENNLFKLFLQNLSDIIEKIEIYSKTLENSITDKLTGCFNRNYFHSRIKNLINRSKRYKEAFTVIMLDIDHFKVFNDKYGHAVGDDALKYFSKIIKKSIRDVDEVFRYGGEEFIIFLPKCDLKQGLIVANRIHKMLNSNKFEIKDQKISEKVTASIGVITPKIKNYEKILEKVDEKLYIAKKKGRNRIVH